MLFRKIKGIVTVFCICSVFTVVAFQLPGNVFGIYSSTQTVRYILDAGHGLPDGGAVGADGTTEQQLNLAVTLALSKKLNEKNITHLLIRNDENSIYTEGETIHAKKVSDVKNRISIAKQTPRATMVSIHMNSYPNASVHGIQVFYNGGNTEAKTLAETLQSAFNAQIQPNNKKVVKLISKNVYLFSHIDNPAVLIECGFLSNTNELEKLKSKEYQEMLAEVIAQALSG